MMVNKKMVRSGI